MSKPRTGAERYFADRMGEPEYAEAYERARRRIDQVDSLVRALDARRVELEWTKADLARAAGMKPEAIRRLFSAENPNPTLATMSAVASALDLEITVADRTPSIRPAPTAARGTRRRTA